MSWTPWQPPVRSLLWFDLFIYLVFLFRLLQQFWYCFKFTFICAISRPLLFHLHFRRPSQTMLLVCTLSSNNTELISCPRHRFCGHILFILFIYSHVCAACTGVCERPHLQRQRRMLAGYLPPLLSALLPSDSLSLPWNLFVSHPFIFSYIILAIFLISYFTYLFLCSILKK